MRPALSETVGGGRIVEPLSYEVAYADTDAGGIVYHAAYVAMAERSRNHVLKMLGLPVSQMKTHFGVLLVVREVRAVYHRPALVGDVLALRSGVVSASPARALWRTIIDRDGELICDVEAEIAAFDPRAGGPRLIPAELGELLMQAPSLTPARRAPRMRMGPDEAGS